MSLHDPEIPDVDQIHAALDEAINLPLAHLLAIEEFVDKVGGIDRAKLALESLNDMQKAA